MKIWSRSEERRVGKSVDVAVTGVQTCALPISQRDTYKEEKVVAEQFLQWKQQYLILDDISLEEAAILIGNKYHVKVSFLNDGMKQCRISATFLDNENLEQIGRASCRKECRCSRDWSSDVCSSDLPT